MLKWVYDTMKTHKNGAPDGHLQRVTIPDAILIQFVRLMMSTVVLEICRGI
jgi:hypothetical protein